jgi:UDP-N-acetylglucosamine 2-epimerase
MRIVTVLGARPQFIKAAPVRAALAQAGHEEILVHTGQHYDDSMSDVFFREMQIAAPAVNLDVGSGSHGAQTGIMLQRIEAVLLEQKPDLTLVYGDTNSTLAGALAACKLRIPVAHVEAGLRSWNRAMPEEHNRVLTDHCSDILFCPTPTAVDNLRAEGIRDGVHQVGDTMLDAVNTYAEVAKTRSQILKSLGLAEKTFFLATIHRPYNTDAPETLGAILAAFATLPLPVVLPMHPRTRAVAERFGLRFPANLKSIEPVGYLDMLRLELAARVILTDSGGVQKEACFLGTPCVTLRPETEWIETVQAGWNRLASPRGDELAQAVQSFETGELRPPLLCFGDGAAAAKIVKVLSRS